LPNTDLKKFLKKHAVGETLAVLDSKLGNLIKEKLQISCMYRSVGPSNRATYRMCLFENVCTYVCVCVNVCVLLWVEEAAVAFLAAVAQ
jgi:hypothetical protein